jgi:hypothetical protein
LSSLDFPKGATASWHPEKWFTRKRTTYAIPSLFSALPKSTADLDVYEWSWRKPIGEDIHVLNVFGNLFDSSFNPFPCLDQAHFRHRKWRSYNFIEQLGMEPSH